MTTKVENGRSIPDSDLELIDKVWGQELPAVRKAVQKLRGHVVPDAEAMKLERVIAQAVRAYTLRNGKPLDSSAARVLFNLAPCVDTGPYGIGSVWDDIKGASSTIGLSGAHLRRMLINDKIKVKMIRRPSPGNVAKKRWIDVADLQEQL